jgi:hypothetical protein
MCARTREVQPHEALGEGKNRGFERALADQTIRAYEVKRGNGQFDAGKIRSIKRDLMCVQVLLKSLRRVRDAKSRRGRIKNHLLLWCAVNPASVVSYQNRVR